MTGAHNIPVRSLFGFMSNLEGQHTKGNSTGHIYESTFEEEISLICFPSQSYTFSLFINTSILAR